MNVKSIAPCGLVCDLCLGFQRKKDTCVGCNAEGNKPPHCASCGIKLCKEKNGDPALLCNTCDKYPCRRLKDLDKRYSEKYGESLIENFAMLEAHGVKAFLASVKNKWQCPRCGKLLCVHRERCQHCGETNDTSPR